MASAAGSAPKSGNPVVRYLFSKVKGAWEWTKDNRGNLAIVGSVCALTKMSWDGLHRVPPGHVALIVKDKKVRNATTVVFFYCTKMGTVLILVRFNSKILEEFFDFVSRFMIDQCI